MRIASIYLLAASLAAAAEPSKTIVIKAARMFDGKSGSVTSPGVVVVATGKILGIGPGAQIPPGAEVLDLGDATLLPGFMDAHTHLSGDYIEDWKQGELDRMRKPIPERALDATENLRKTLMAGFTTCRDESFATPAAQHKAEREVAAFRRYQELSRELVEVNARICRARPVEASLTPQEKKRPRRSSTKRRGK